MNIQLSKPVVLDTDANADANAPWIALKLTAPPITNRIPVHLCCLIDVSGSMNELNKIGHVRQSLDYFVDSLGEEDYLSIITFQSVSKTLVERQLMTSSAKKKVRSQIHLLSAAGETDLCSSFLHAQSQLMPYDMHRKQGFMLLTDGDANVGHTVMRSIFSQIHPIFRDFPGTSLSCIGYGTNHNGELLKQMSQTFGGSYYIVQQSTDVPIVFGDIMGGLLSAVTQRVTLRIQGDVKIRSAYPVSSSAMHHTITIGDLSAEKEAVILLQASLMQGPSVQASLMQGPSVQASSLQASSGTTLTLSYDSEGNAEEIEIPITDVSPSLLANLHLLRYDVVDLMKEIVLLSVPYSPFLDQAVKDKIKENKQRWLSTIAVLKKRTEEMKDQTDEILITLIEQELNHCEAFVSYPKTCCLDFRDILNQRAVCLAMLRGVAASSSRQFSYDCPAGSQVLPQLSQTYSNGMQREISTQYYDNYREANLPSLSLPSLPSLPSLSMAPPSMGATFSYIPKDYQHLWPDMSFLGSSSLSVNPILQPSFTNLQPRLKRSSVEQSNEEDEFQPGHK